MREGVQFQKIKHKLFPLFRFFFSLATILLRRLLRRLLLSRGQTMKVAVIQQQFNRRAPFTVGRVLQDSHSQDKRVLPGGRRGGVKREMVKEKLRTNIVTDEYVKSKICNKSTAKAQNKKRLAVTACLAQSVERKTFNLVVVGSTPTAGTCLLFCTNTGCKDVFFCISTGCTMISDTHAQLTRVW